MTDKNRETPDSEARQQSEAEAHRRPYGQTKTVEIDGAEGTHPELEKTTSREPIETSMRGTEDTAPEAHHAPSEGRSQDEPAP